MRRLAIFLAVATGVPLTAPAEETFRMSLESANVGQLPQGWIAAKTGEGPGSVWKVVEDSTAPHGRKALAQTSDEGPNRLFNLCVAQKTAFKDVELALALKAVAGKLDQGGGPVWRYRDANNYYIARMNPLEENYRLYKVVEGKRIQLASADVKAPAGKWHALRIVHNGNRIRCYLNGRLYLDVIDDTFQDAGKIGLWTKADAQTCFAHLRAEEDDAEEQYVTLEQVPPAVRATIEKEARGATVKEIEKETKGGKTIYEAEWMENGHEVEIEVAEDGTLIDKEVEDAAEDDDEAKQ